MNRPDHSASGPSAAGRRNIHDDRFRHLVESTTDYAIFTMDLDGVIETWNPGAEQVLGWSAAEAIGQHGSLVFTPEDRALDAPAREMTIARTHGRATDERWHVKKSGARFWASGVILLLKDDAGTPIGMAKIVRDLTDRRHAERLQEGQQAILERIALGEPVGPILETVVRVIEAQAPGTHGAVLLLGGDGELQVAAAPNLPAELVAALQGTDPNDDTDPCAVAALRNESVVATDLDPDVAGATTMVATPMRGTAGQVIGVFVLYYDTAEAPPPGHAELVETASHLASMAVSHHRAQVAVLEERSRLQTTIENVEVAVVTCDAHGVLAPLNRVARTLFPPSVTPAAPTEWPLRFGLYTADGARLLRADEVPLYRALNGEHVHDYEMMVAADDTARVMLVSARPMLGADGTTLGAVAAMHDITERRRHEEALRHTQRLESLGVLAGGVAHQFNNLLTAMLGNLSLAQRALSAESRNRTDPLLRDALAAGERAAALTQQLLAYAGKGPLVMEPVDLCKLIEETADLFQLTVSRHIDIRVVAEPNCPPVHGDTGQLRQLLLNLILNAAEAMEGGPGTITVAVRVETLDAGQLRRSFRPPDLPPGHYLRADVTDHGVGIAADTLDRIFDPFYSTKFLGRGLGLSAAQGIVRSHHGGIAVTSKPGDGTTFSVVLPVMESGLKPTVPSVSPAGESVTVLLVDDEEAVRRVAQLALRGAGYNVVLAANGREAIERLAEARDRFRAVVLDVALPFLSGVETLAQLRSIRPDIPVLLMSGYSERFVREFFAGDDVPNFLQKPFAPDALVKAIESVLEHRAPDRV